MAIQLQEFAKQVLFGTTIEEKLSFPREPIIDTAPGSPIQTPRQLPRPPHLALREDGVRANHPARAKLIDERERGRLLHFFGNHELLATELMALVLLKFPEAPASFRQGVLETLKEEQIHTRLYMHRMRQCGVEFGELPLSDYFWKSVSSMEDPLDYVTRLSLTFEQANLDYAREYGDLFARVGDDATAQILSKIYRDEIEHVGFGLKWFRRWKAAGKTDWEAYRERLVFPLSPSRAKGNDFNHAGRLEVGLEESFIRNLRLFTQSRGRTPTVWWFNPAAEHYAAQNSAAGQVQPRSALEKDLAFLPAYLSRQDDLLFVPTRPSAEFLHRLQEAGFHLPEIVLETQTPEGAPVAADLARKLGELRPWAWTPDSVAFFRTSFEALTQPAQPEALWNDAIRALFSKTWSATHGRQWAAEDAAAERDWIAPPAVYGELCPDLETLRRSRERFAALGYRDLVCKAPFGTAANGARRLFAGDEIEGSFCPWFERLEAAQGAVVLEPWLERVFDFSVQGEMHAEGLKTVAFTRLVNNARGQFRGIVTGAFADDLAPALRRFLLTRVEGKPRIYRWYEETIGPRLAAALAAVGYRGPLGLDAFVYRDLGGQLRLKSIVELNPRHTMGRVAHELGQHNASGSAGYFEILSRSQLQKTGYTCFEVFAETLGKDFPIVLSNGPKPKLRSGSIPLNDPATARQFLALYHVRDAVADLPIRR